MSILALKKVFTIYITNKYFNTYGITCLYASANDQKNKSLMVNLFQLVDIIRIKWDYNWHYTRVSSVSIFFLHLFADLMKTCIIVAHLIFILTETRQIPTLIAKWNRLKTSQFVIQVRNSKILEWASRICTEARDKELPVTLHAYLIIFHTHLVIFNPPLSSHILLFIIINMAEA